MQKKVNILVAPLNWGLGHASRCVPIIQELLNRGVTVFIASNGGALALLKEEFPELEVLALDGITIRYPKHRFFMLHFLFQLPRLLRSMKQEHNQLLKLVEKYELDAVISDNRYGLYHHKIPSVLITHQLFIKSSFGSRQLHHWVYKLVERFTYCWVPDYPKEKSLSGDLAHQRSCPDNTSYIGALSRFKAISSTSKYKRKLLVVLSGPEPSRSVFEEKLLKQLLSFEIPCLVVQGIVSEQQQGERLSNHVERINFLNQEQLQDEISNSELVLCRSGYSSIMDLYRLRKKALLVPTKGQVEQEYLAKYVLEQKLFYTVNEDDLELEKHMKKALEFKQHLPEEGTSNTTHIDLLITSLR